MSSDGRWVTSMSPTVTVPSRTSTAPTTLLSRVLFPDPFGPTMETIRPGSASRDTPRTTGAPPYPATTPARRSEAPVRESSADKVGLHNLGTAAKRGHRSLGEHCSLGHDDDRVAELVHDGELVLDHHDRHSLLAERHQFGADLAGELGVDPGERLVEQE